MLLSKLLLLIFSIVQGNIDMEFPKLILWQDTQSFGLLPLHSYLYLAQSVVSSIFICGVSCSKNNYCNGVLYSNDSSGACILTRAIYRDRLVDTLQPSQSSNGWKLYLNKRACPTEWFPFDDHCYFYAATLANFTTAMNDCQQRDSYLVEINFLEENNWISREFGNASLFWTWIGFTDTEVEGVFQWTRKSTSVTFLNWRDNEPSNVPDQNCAGLAYGEGVWNDMPCEILIPYVCENDRF